MIKVVIYESCGLIEITKIEVWHETFQCVGG